MQVKNEKLRNEELETICESLRQSLIFIAYQGVKKKSEINDRYVQVTGEEVINEGRWSLYLRVQEDSLVPILRMKTHNSTSAGHDATIHKKVKSEEYKLEAYIFFIVKDSIETHRHTRTHSRKETLGLIK